MTPKELAKDLIRPYVLRGDSVENLANSRLGYVSQETRVQIGGFVTVNGDPYQVSNRKVAVTKIEGKTCLHFFSLKALYAEIMRGEQLSLFDLLQQE